MTRLARKLRLHGLLFPWLGNDVLRGLAGRHGRLAHARRGLSAEFSASQSRDSPASHRLCVFEISRSHADAAGEVAYTAAVFSRPVSFFTGWIMMLAYFIVCPWEAVCCRPSGWFHFSLLNRIELYSVAGKPVYLSHLVIGLGLTVLVTIVNYRGVRLSATFQNWTTFGTLALFISLSRLASPEDRRQLSAVVYPTPFISILLCFRLCLIS